jgi:hypothetical protein
MKSSSLIALALTSALGAIAGNIPADDRRYAIVPTTPTRTRGLTPAAAADKRAKRNKNKAASKARAKNKKGR